MNQYVISKYLQLLRKQHGFTQETLADKLMISRQAISKWETGNTIPDLELLLKLSKLYQITINEILEPQIKTPEINNIEQIIGQDKEIVKETVKSLPISDIVKASMGVSPQVYQLLRELFPDIDFKEEREKIGNVQIDEIEAIHSQIVSLLNLSFF